MRYSHDRFLATVVFAMAVGAVGVSNVMEAASFTVSLLPDTQFYSEEYPDTYKVQTQWIKDRAEQDNIRFVIHLGDIVQNQNTHEVEWQNADAAHDILDDGAIPYSVLPGNHDKVARDSTLYNKYFGPARFAGKSWYGGHMNVEKNDNNYCLFEASGMKFMVLSLEYLPTDEMLAWADGIVDAHPDHRVILATHYYLELNGRSTTTSGNGVTGNSGENIWDEFVSKHENIFMVVCGHKTGVNHQTSINDAGGQVHEILCDYQNAEPNGGNGWLQTLRFEPEEDKIYVEAYSPLLDQYNTDPEHTYTLDCDMETIPEPSTLALLAVGVVALLWRRRRSGK